MQLGCCLREQHTPSGLRIAFARSNFIRYMSLLKKFKCRSATMKTISISRVV